MTKLKKRGFVMTGGGAKGLYEAGVIHAFHITGMEFDVITGSSIGAMNSAFFAEYLYQKRRLPQPVQQDSLQAVEALDGLVKAYHHAWLLLPEKRVIDDSPSGPLGQLKDDLLHFDLRLPQLVRLAWWGTDPQRGAIPEPGVWPALRKLVVELAERLGGFGQVLRIFKDHRQALVKETTRTYLDRFGMARSLIPPADDGKLKDIFTQPVSPLRHEHLDSTPSAPDSPGAQQYSLLDPARTLRDYAREGIEVRLTRANFRTGRLEISAYLPAESFVRFMRRQAWRLQVEGAEKIPLGSFRLQVPGNPSAIQAALCSGRFPGVFMPFPLRQIYPPADPENELLYRLLSGWLDDAEVEARLSQSVTEPEAQAAAWEKLYASWRQAESMREFFPRVTDTYVDGGAIDNTPSNSAVDFVREWADQQGLSKRDVELELFVIFLGTEPKIAADAEQDPNLVQVVKRTLDIMGVAKESNDTNTVSTINTFGKRGEELGQALKLVLETLQENPVGLSAAQQSELEAQLRARAQQMALKGYLGKDADGFLERMSAWADDKMARGLPLHVTEVKIYPEKMPLGTLQFTERLGYRQPNAIEMLTMGCYNTLESMRTHLESQPASQLDELDRRAQGLLQHWMGAISPLPQGEAAGGRVSTPAWRCQRTACVFHARHCKHGAGG